MLSLVVSGALALGASESTLLEMTGAYAGILNGGTAVAPYGLIDLRLQGDEAPLMGQEGGLGERVISTEAARPTTGRCASVAGGTNAETQARSTARRRKRSMAISNWMRQEGQFGGVVWNGLAEPLCWL